MRQNTQPEKQSLTPMQKQAVLVCIVCALAALLTIGITLVLIHRGKEPAASSEQPGTEQPADDANIADHYQINEQSSAPCWTMPLPPLPVTRSCPAAT